MSSTAAFVAAPCASPSSAPPGESIASCSAGAAATASSCIVSTMAWRLWLRWRGDLRGRSVSTRRTRRPLARQPEGRVRVGVVYLPVPALPRFGLVGASYIFQRKQNFQEKKIFSFRCGRVDTPVRQAPGGLVSGRKRRTIPCFGSHHRIISRSHQLRWAGVGALRWSHCYSAAFASVAQ